MKPCASPVPPVSSVHGWSWGSWSAATLFGPPFAIQVRFLFQSTSSLFFFLIDPKWLMDFVTVLCSANVKKVKHLLDLPKAETHLTLWKADLADEGSFDEAIKGCTGVFHVATPMDFESKDPEVLFSEWNTWKYLNYMCLGVLQNLLRKFKKNDLEPWTGRCFWLLRQQVKESCPFSVAAGFWLPKLKS